MRRARLVDILTALSSEVVDSRRAFALGGYPWGYDSSNGTSCPDIPGGSWVLLIHRGE